MSDNPVPDIELVCTVCDFEAHAEDVPLEEITESQSVYHCPDCGATKFREAGKEPMEMPEEPPANRRRRINEAKL
jgi:predicted RNA-binding Zn-ribbon protein involved in translation (DUF1610 family)